MNFNELNIEQSVVETCGIYEMLASGLAKKLCEHFDNMNVKPDKHIINDYTFIITLNKGLCYEIKHLMIDFNSHKDFIEIIIDCSCPQLRTVITLIDILDKYIHNFKFTQPLEIHANRISYKNAEKLKTYVQSYKII